jgi:hypothetical protein
MFLCCLYKRGKYTAGQLEMFPLTLGSFELLFYHLKCEQGQFIRPQGRLVDVEGGEDAQQGGGVGVREIEREGAETGDRWGEVN